jgi:hypothetical protein
MDNSLIIAVLILVAAIGSFVVLARILLHKWNTR